MLDDEEKNAQQQLLSTYRATLRQWLLQAAQFGGEAFAPPPVSHGIKEARQQIQRIKTVLRQAGTKVADYPNDDLTVAVQDNISHQEDLQDKIINDVNPSTSSHDYLTKRSSQPACPYPGLHPYDNSNATIDSEGKKENVFFGRDAEIREAIMHLEDYGCLVIVGPSGAGKSSLVKAGILPKLESNKRTATDQWLILQLRPENQPVQNLVNGLGATSKELANIIDSIAARHQVIDETFVTTIQHLVNRICKKKHAQRLLILIDQFEEIFTLCGDIERRQFFTLIKFLKEEVDNCVLLITVRADYFGHLMENSIWEILDDQLMNVAPLRGQALQDAIELPAKAVNVTLEPTLVQQLLADAADEPGSLPLVQATMSHLWREIHDNCITLSSYKKLGNDKQVGLFAAISKTADATLAQLTTDQQKIARRIFLRLIQFGQGRADIRRQQLASELTVERDDPEQFKKPSIISSMDVF